MYPRTENARARKEAAMAFALSDLKLRSPAFGYHTRIPTRFTQDGENLSPPLVWENVPEGTESFAILCHDPDAPLVQHGMYGFVHWLLAGIPGDARSLEEGTEIGIPGRNDGGSEGYRGPRPPEGHGTHHYYFWLFALDAEPALPRGLDIAAFLNAVEPHVLGMNRLVGTYRRGD